MNPHSEFSARSVWQRDSVGRLAGLLLAAETGAVIAWDAAQRLIVWDRQGNTIGEQQLRAVPAAVAVSADGRWIVVCDRVGRVSWYDPQLSLQFDYNTGLVPLAIAVEPFGQYMLLSDRQRRNWLYSRLGKPIIEVESPRPLHFLHFLLPAAAWVGCSDYGYIACYDYQGSAKWRDKPLFSIGSCATDHATSVALAGYSEGVLIYDPKSGALSHARPKEPGRLISTSANGKFHFLLSDSSGQPEARLSLLKSDGKVLGKTAVPATAAFLAAGALGDTCVYGTKEGRVVKVAWHVPDS